MVNELKVNIKKKLNRTEELDVSFYTQSNGILGVVGPSGSGKSTLLKCIAGIDKPSSGTIEFNGKLWFDEQKKTQLPIGNRNIGYLPQNTVLFPHMTARQNIAFASQHISDGLKSFMEDLALTPHIHKKPNYLSGGQQQRFGFIRALAGDNTILLLDEPFSAQDAKNKHKMLDILKVQQHKIMLLVSHDENLMKDYCDELIFL